MGRQVNELALIKTKDDFLRAIGYYPEDIASATIDLFQLEKHQYVIIESDLSFNSLKEEIKNERFDYITSTTSIENYLEQQHPNTT